MWFFVVCTLIDNEYASLLFSQSFFELFLHKINLRCFLKVFVNKPSHLIEFRSGEDQYFIFKPKQVKIESAESKKPLISLDRRITDQTFVVRLRPSFTTSKKDFRCLLLSKFPMQKSTKRRRRGMDLHIFREFSQLLECLDEPI